MILNKEPYEEPIKEAYYPAQTIAAGSYAVISDTALTGRRLNGWRVTGVASYNVSILQAYIDGTNGLYMIIKNNGSSQITTGAIYVYYI